MKLIQRVSERIYDICLFAVLGIPTYMFIFMCGVAFDSPKSAEYYIFKARLEEKIDNQMVSINQELTEHLKKPHVYARER